jgi:hypothetical protein
VLKAVYSVAWKVVLLAVSKVEKKVLSMADQMAGMMVVWSEEASVDLLVEWKVVQMAE